jgi:hypothetical protein
LGGNTRYGFRGFYDQLLIPGDNKDRVFIIKGGPGTGKSTFIKRVGAELSNAGWDITYIRCSGDPASMDGVICPDAGVAVVDGTAPHVLDPSCPGAREEILNFGDYWDTDMLIRHRPDIIKLDKEKKEYVKRAYNYLGAAGLIYDDNNHIFSDAVEIGKLNNFIAKLLDELFYDMDYSVKMGTDIKFFATAVTASGIQGDVENLFKNQKVYSIKVPFGYSTSYVLEKVKQRAHTSGYMTESFYSGFDSESLEHVSVPELDFCVVTSNDFHPVQGSDLYYEYPIEGFFAEYALCSAKDDLKYNRIRFDELLEKAERCLFKSRQRHNEMEEIFISSMDFDELELYSGLAMSAIENAVQQNIDM